MSQKSKKSCKECLVGWKNFKSLSDEHLSYIEERRYEATFKPGENIFKQGAPTSNAIFLSSGLVKAYVEGQKNKNHILSIMGPGQMIIGPGLYTNSQHIYSITALNNASCCFIDSEAIKKMIRENSTFAEQIISDINESAKDNINKLMYLTQKKMPGRLAEVLIYLADVVFKSDKFTLILSRQELADMAAMAKESVVRVLKNFADDKIINYGILEFEILKKEKLKMICENG